MAELCPGHGGLDLYGEVVSRAMVETRQGLGEGIGAVVDGSCEVAVISVRLG